MDPIYLRADELDYELTIRGICDLATTRQKTHSLRECLKREAYGEKFVREDFVEHLVPISELEVCGQIVESLAAVTADDRSRADRAEECRSRLWHVIDRVKRMRRLGKAEQELADDIVQGAKDMLAEVGALAQTENAGHVPQVASAKAASPLASIIETIRASRSTPRVSPVQVTSNRSTLNPFVEEFVPVMLPDGDALPPTRFSDRFGAPARGYDRSYDPVQAIRRGVRDSAASGRQSLIGDNHHRPMRYATDQQQPHFWPRPVAPVYEPCFREAAPPRARTVEREYDQHPQRAFHRRTVPVHQWKLSFSGDGNGLHLYDFLAELRMFQRSEGVSDDELFASVVHLLNGRARLWYRSCFDTFGNWGEFTEAMKREFLPPKFDYRLLSNISTRRQKSTETFAEYLSTMRSLFQYLSIPIDEQHKLCIVEENMLSKYAVAAAAVEVQSLEQLANVCRRIDFAYARQPQAFPLDDHNVATRQPVRQAYGARTREVQELAAFAEPIGVDRFEDLAISRDDAPRQQEQRDAFGDSEVMEIRRGDRREVRRAPEALSRKCYNCEKDGHVFADCPVPKTGSFCYRCGSRNVTSFTCQQCPKNEATGSAPRSASSNRASQ